MVIGLHGVQLGLKLYEWLTKSDDFEAGVQFVNHDYDYRLNWTTRCYQLIITITISNGSKSFSERTFNSHLIKIINKQNYNRLLILEENTAVYGPIK